MILDIGFILSAVIYQTSNPCLHAWTEVNMQVNLPSIAHSHDLHSAHKLLLSCSARLSLDQCPPEGCTLLS